VMRISSFAPRSRLVRASFVATQCVFRPFRRLGCTIRHVDHPDARDQATPQLQSFVGLHVPSRQMLALWTGLELASELSANRGRFALMGSADSTPQDSWRENNKLEMFGWSGSAQGLAEVWPEEFTGSPQRTRSAFISNDMKCAEGLARRKRHPRKRLRCRVVGAWTNRAKGPMALVSAC
jgi:hypothetical protein